MRPETVARCSVGAVGVLVGLYGAWLLLSREDGDQLVSVGTWLLGGVLLHDAAIAAAVLVAGLAVVRLVPEAAKAPVTVGAVVLGSVTLAAIPVLLAYGRKPDNPTLLDRDYALGWLVLAGLVVTAVAVATVLRARRAGQAGKAQRPRVAGDPDEGED